MPVERDEHGEHVGRHDPRSTWKAKLFRVQLTVQIVSSLLIASVFGVDTEKLAVLIVPMGLYFASGQLSKNTPLVLLTTAISSTSLVCTLVLYASWATSFGSNEDTLGLLMFVNCFISFGLLVAVLVLTPLLDRGVRVTEREAHGIPSQSNSRLIDVTNGKFSAIYLTAFIAPYFIRNENILGAPEDGMLAMDVFVNIAISIASAVAMTTVSYIRGQSIGVRWLHIPPLVGGLWMVTHSAIFGFLLTQCSGHEVLPHEHTYSEKTMENIRGLALWLNLVTILAVLFTFYFGARSMVVKR